MDVWTFVAVLYDSKNAASWYVFIVVFFLTYMYTRKPKGIPPGPKYTLPIVGDLPLLIGGDIFDTFRKLRQKHSDIFSFYIGKELTIVLNSYEAIHEAAVVNGHVFSYRPSNIIIDETGGKMGIIRADGLLWKNQRKFTLGHLHHLGFGKSSFETQIWKEIECIFKVLKAYGGQPCDFRKYIHASTANVVFSIVCGRRYDYDDETFQKLLHDIEIAASQGLKAKILLSCFPFLKYVPGDLSYLKLMKENHILRMDFYRNLYEEHAKYFDKNDPKDFIDMCIMEMAKGDNPEFTVDQLSMIARDIFAGGAETTATVIRWAVLYLLKYQDIKTRLQSDIDSIIPENRVPRLDDKAKLPYVEAFIMEVLRCANITPFALPHAVTTNDVVLRGHKIPNLFNLDSVLKDPDIFENPLLFNPDRFIDIDGKVFRPKEFIPFGIGRRICLGKTVAMMELFLFLTAMIKQFDFVLLEGQSEPDMQGVLGITHAPKPFKVRFIQRTTK